MAGVNKVVSQAELMEHFKYNPLTGIFKRIKPNKYAHHIKKNGDVGNSFLVAGKSYIKVRFKNNNYLAHRLAWLYVYGEFPKHGLDHINGNGLDNRISNLRDATPIENSKNQRLRKNNKSGVMGVSFTNNRWRARITVKGKEIYLGRFSDKKDAVEAKKDAEAKYGFHENHGTQRPL